MSRRQGHRASGSYYQLDPNLWLTSSPILQGRLQALSQRHPRPGRSADRQPVGPHPTTTQTRTNRPGRGSPAPTLHPSNTYST